MKKLRLVAAVLGLLISFSAVPAQAFTVWGACDGNSSTVCSGTKDDATSTVKKIINLMLFAIGITAVILIIHSGLKYVTSRGDPGSIKSAKDTLLYAVIGLVVASLAYTIVNFVVTAFE